LQAGLSENGRRKSEKIKKVATLAWGYEIKPPGLGVMGQPMAQGGKSSATIQEGAEQRQGGGSESARMTVSPFVGRDSGEKSREGVDTTDDRNGGKVGSGAAGVENGSITANY